MHIGLQPVLKHRYGIYLRREAQCKNIVRYGGDSSAAFTGWSMAAEPSCRGGNFADNAGLMHFAD
jgi:hypothetical protein